MFHVGQHENFAGLGGEYLVHEFQQLDGGRGGGPRRGGDRETHGLVRVGIEGEKHRGHFERFGFLVVTVAAHLPLAVTLSAMRIDRQQFTREIARGATNSPQGDLQSL